MWVMYRLTRRGTLIRLDSKRDELEALDMLVGTMQVCPKWAKQLFLVQE